MQSWVQWIQQIQYELSAESSHQFPNRLKPSLHLKGICIAPIDYSQFHLSRSPNDDYFEKYPSLPKIKMVLRRSIDLARQISCRCPILFKQKRFNLLGIRIFSNNCIDPRQKHTWNFHPLQKRCVEVQLGAFWWNPSNERVPERAKDHHQCSAQTGPSWVAVFQKIELDPGNTKSNSSKNLFLSTASFY